MSEVQTTERVASNLVTSENLTAFNADRLRLTPVETKEPPKEEVKAEPQEEPEAKELPKEVKKEPKKTGFSERLAELAAQRKSAEEKATKAEEARLQAEKERDELKAKSVPQEKIDPGQKPTLAQFDNNAEKWGDALIEWHQKESEKKAQEKAVKEAFEGRQRTFAERVSAVKKELPDFQEKIDANKDVFISPYMQETILESDLGPRILYHFAENPEEAIRIGKLSPISQVRELTRLEDKLTPKKEVKEEEKPELKAVPSKAPPPINPVKTSSGGEVQTKIDSNGEFTGTPAEWKALRKAGKV